jgi:hypothetical protein
MSENSAKCCSKNCLQFIAEEEQASFLEKFKLCSSFESKNAFIVGNVKETSLVNGKKRKFFRVYNVGARQVCLNSFCQILEISKKKVRIVMDKNQDGNLKIRGGRGRKKLSASVKSAIENHVNSFPRYYSHYKRAKSESMYLDPGLNLTILYDLFQEKWNEENPGVKPPSSSSYRKVFFKMGLKFKNLKTDTCKTCDRLNIAMKASGNNAELKKEQELHWDQAKAIRGQMEHDFEVGRNNEKVQGICFDLQKTFTLPKSPTNVFYYTRNLNVFNLGVHDGKTDAGYFHVWVENEGGRGAREIGSCLMKFLGSYLEEKAEEIILWSDSCGGQNRNYILCLILHRFLAEQKTLKRVILRFLKSGHSYNICDTDFGSTEAKIKKQQSIFTPCEIIKLLQQSRTEKPFKVTKMNVEDFFSADNLIENITKREKDLESKEKVSWLSTHEIILSREHPFKLYLNYDITTDHVSARNFKIDCCN